MQKLIGFLRNPAGSVAVFFQKFAINIEWLPPLDLNVPSVAMAAFISYFVVPQFTTAIGIPGPFWPAAFLVVLWVTLQTWVTEIVFKAIATPFSSWRAKSANNSPTLDLLFASANLVGACLVLTPVQLKLLSFLNPSLLMTSGWKGVFTAWVLLILGEVVLSFAIRINTDEDETTN